MESQAVRSAARNVLHKLNLASRRIDALDIDDALLFLEDANHEYRNVVAASEEVPADGDSREVRFRIELMTELDASVSLVEAMVYSLQLKAVHHQAFQRAYYWAVIAQRVIGKHHFYARWELCKGALECYFGDYSEGTVRVLARAEAWLREDKEKSPERGREWRQACCRLAVAYSKIGNDEKALEILLMAAEHISELDKHITMYDVTILVMATVLLWNRSDRYAARQMLGRAKITIKLAPNAVLADGTSGQNVRKLEHYMSPLGFFIRLFRKPRDVVEWPWI